MGRTPEERFWAKVNIGGPEDCWDWMGTKSKRSNQGYLMRNGKFYISSRMAWELTNGPIPKGEGYHGICVCHKCDNPKCCNPNHLFLGTHLDNMKDKVKKNRQSHVGGRQPFKLTQNDLRGILALKGIFTQRKVASFFSVSHVTIHKIWQGKEGYKI